MATRLNVLEFSDHISAKAGYATKGGPALVFNLASAVASRPLCYLQVQADSARDVDHGSQS